MSSRTEIFEKERPRLFQIAYRMLGTRADAEDVLQEIALKFEHANVVSERAWLTSATIRACIDTLRSARRNREEYIGEWLPEPMADSSLPSDALERHEAVSYALLVALEVLSAKERATFVLREAFDYSFSEIATLLDETEATCRQLAHRAHERIEDGKPRNELDRSAHNDLVLTFASAVAAGDPSALATLLAHNVRLVSDGGGKRPTAMVPVVGAAAVSAFLLGLAKKNAAIMIPAFEAVNGQVGIVLRTSTEVDSVLNLVAEHGKIVSIYITRNPEKLTSFSSPS